MPPQIRTEFPRPIRVIEHTWIPLRDGTRLAARIWLPADAERQPVPALLEYIPYRKNDWTATRDALRHPYLAGHGYAAARVDMRGSGDSDGTLLDEYLPQEQDDAVEVIAWLAAQPWCSGAVGMFGKSWGGFNALQVAARRPPALKAIITFYSTDDRYADDIHYIGGCLFGTDHLSWAGTMLAFNARSPDPRFVGERWRERWLRRLEQTPPYLEAWLRHQRRDAFWKHGSVCEDFSAITCAVYAVGGWADGYTNAVPRLLAGLTCPRKGLIGPWAHQYPETSVPGPAIGMLQESLRWWDHWLKGIDTGIMNEPRLRVWLQESAPPATLHAERPGRWVAEPGWPARSTSARRYQLLAGRLRPDVPDEPAPPEAPVTFRGSQLCGLDAGMFYSMSLPGDEPPDQRMEDGLSLVFDAAPVDEPVDVLGFPEVHVALASDRPQALLAARLCDVAPTGESTLVSRGLLNLTHRASHEDPQPLVPGQRYGVRLALRFTGHTLRPGHRWRLALSPTYFPWAWPSPEPVTLTIFTGASTWLDVPVRAPRPEDEQLAAFGPPETSAPLARAFRRSPSRTRVITRDALTGCAELVDQIDAGDAHFEAADLDYDEAGEHRFSITEGNPLSARATTRWRIALGREGWRSRVETVSRLQADAECWHITNQLEVYEAEHPVFVCTWSARIPRDQM
jgi:putative CocE/NonD family hydrolase